MQQKQSLEMPIINAGGNMIDYGNGSYIRLETITPAHATSILNSEYVNRSFHKKTSNRYADTLLNDKWELNGTSIIISRDGILLDGEHRLSAIERSGVSMDTLVMRGADPSLVNNIDSGKPRTDGDLLTIMTYTYGSDFASAIRVATITSLWGAVLRKQECKFRDSLLLDEKVSQLVARIGFPDLHRYVEETARVKQLEKSKVIGVGKMAVIQAMISKELGDDIGHAFMKKVYASYGLSKGDPILGFQRAIVNNSANGIKSSGDGTDFLMLLKAWGHFVKGKMVKGNLSMVGIDELNSIATPKKSVRLYIDEDGLLQRDMNNDNMSQYRVI